MSRVRAAIPGPLVPMAWRIFVVVAIAAAALLLVLAPWRDAPAPAPSAASVAPPTLIDSEGNPIADDGSYKPVDDFGLNASHPLVRYEMPPPAETPVLAAGAVDLTWPDLWAPGAWEPPTINGFRIGTPGKDLFPDGSTEKDIELFFLDLNDMRQMQIVDGTIKPELDGKRVRMAGYTTPVGFGEDETAFLLVPELGACIHVPPPSPNQIVYVPTYEGTAEMFAPVWVTGTLKAEPVATILADAGYRLEDVVVEPYSVQ